MGGWKLVVVFATLFRQAAFLSCRCQQSNSGMWLNCNSSSRLDDSFPIA
jgi:hypothetical protein